MKGMKLLTCAAALAGSWNAAAETPLTGRWVGQAFGNQDAMPVEVHVTEADGEAKASLMLPELVWYSEPDFTLRPDGIDIELPFGLGERALNLSPEGHILATPPGGLGLTLRKVSAAPYATQEVGIPLPEGFLEATLYLPNESVDAPAILIAGGASAQSRHHRSVVAWCHHFVRRKFACLVPERRPDGEVGPGRSDLERDSAHLRAALKYLRAHPAVDPNRVGIAAFSRGNWSALRTAADDPRLRFLFLAAVPALSPAETEKQSVRVRMEADGRSSEEIAAAQRYYDLYFDVASGRRLWAELDAASRAAETAAWGEYVDQPLESAHLDFWARNGEFRNDPDFARVKAPVLAVWGEDDLVVPPGVHEPLLRARLGDAEVTMRVFPDADHMLEVDPGPDALGVWRWPRRAQGLLPALDHWLAERLARPEAPAAD